MIPLISPIVSHGTPSTKLAADLGQVIRSKAQSPWKTVPKNNLRFIVIDAGTNIGTAVGFSESEIENSGISYEKVGSGLRFLGTQFPKLDFFTGYDSTSCGENQHWSATDLEKVTLVKYLTKTTGRPILLISSRLPKVGLKFINIILASLKSNFF